jgi:hypothetical protein
MFLILRHPSHPSVNDNQTGATTAVGWLEQYNDDKQIS